MFQKVGCLLVANSKFTRTYCVVISESLIKSPWRINFVTISVTHLQIFSKINFTLVLKPTKSITTNIFKGCWRATLQTLLIILSWFGKSHSFQNSSSEMGSRSFIYRMALSGLGLHIAYVHFLFCNRTSLVVHSPATKIPCLPPTLLSTDMSPTCAHAV